MKRASILSVTTLAVVVCLLYCVSDNSEAGSSRGLGYLSREGSASLADGNSTDGLVLIPGGEYQMGDYFDDYNYIISPNPEKPRHWVFVDTFLIARHEVTNQQYVEFLNNAFANNLIEVKPDNIVYKKTTSYAYCPTYDSTHNSRIGFTGSAFTVVPSDKLDHPLTNVTWYGAAAYCNWRSEQLGKELCYNPTTFTPDLSKKGYRMPTEAEWEYAARGCLPGRRFPWGDTISHAQANYYSVWRDGHPYYPYDVSPTPGYHPAYDDVDPHTAPVGSFAANGYGLYDMAGNVWEWCNDWYLDTYYSSSCYCNPPGPTSGSSRVIRGGAWHNNAYFCRGAARNNRYPSDHYVGFRVVSVLETGCGLTIHNITKDTYHETIQEAIDEATAGDTIRVPSGIYTDDGNRDIDFKGKGITVRSRDPNDPNSVGATIIDCNGTSADLHRGFYFHSGEDANSVLDGFTIINGYSPNEPFGASEYSAGGGIYCKKSSPTIRNCVITNNYSAYWGGGLHCDGSYAVIEKCTFRGNESADTGGGLYSRLSSITVNDCQFVDNSADYGGGIYTIDGTSSVRNTVFVGNYAGINGGALRNKRVTSTIANCTFFNNQAPSGGAIHNVLCAGTAITNCILWGNPDSEIEGDAEVTYCDLTGGWPGLGNIDADPSFADPDNSDYHLKSDSPCINAGDPNYAPAEDETDFDGQPRILNAHIDIGADEYAILHVSADSPNDPGTGMREDPYRRIQDAIEASTRGSEINVAEGQYNESITITHDVELYGGYDSAAWGLARNPAANETIIHSSGDNENVISVVDASVTIDGFTIENGWQVYHSDEVAYGGIYCASSDETVFTVQISNNIIQNNIVYVGSGEDLGYSNRGYGGGIYCGRYIEPIIVDNIIRNNKITFHAGSTYAVGGAGIYCAGSRCKISDNVVVDNQIESYDGGGGAARCEGGGIRVGGGVVSQNTVLRNNVYSGGHYGAGRVAGGGIYSDGPAIITQNVVTGNHLTVESTEVNGATDEARGGGIYAPASEITSNIVSGNTCHSRGGGGYLTGHDGASGIAYGGGIFAPSGTLTGNLVMANEAVGGGGVSDSQIPSDCSIAGDGIAMGGGIYAPSATLTGNLVAHNAVIGDAGSGFLVGPESEGCVVAGGGIARGGGICAPGATLLNNTVADNRAAATPGYVYTGYHIHDPNLDGVSIFEGAGIYGGDRIRNTIIWANSPDDLAGTDCNNVTYCDIGGGVCTGQMGNISVDPCFADANNSDYHLKSQADRWDANEGRWTKDEMTSPCVDAGDPMVPIGHEPFPNGGIINMGAYGGTAEASKSYFGREVCETIVDGDINGDCRIDGKDLELMVFHWLEDIPTSPPPCETIVAGDMNGDCCVDFRDFMIMALHWCEDNNP